MSSIEEFEPEKYQNQIDRINNVISLKKEEIEKISNVIEILRNESMNLMRERDKEISEGLSVLF